MGLGLSISVACSIELLLARALVRRQIPTMDLVLELINHPDFATFVLMGLLGFVGTTMTESQPDLQTWSYRIAAGAFLAYSAFAVRTFRPSTSDECVHIVFRGLVAAGLTLGFSRIQLAVARFAYDHTIARAQTQLREWRNNARERAREWEDELRRRSEDEAKLAAEQERARAPSRTEVVRQAVAQAKQDYEVDCETIRSLGLRPDERRAALLEAKQKLMRRLSEALQ